MGAMARVRESATNIFEALVESADDSNHQDKVEKEQAPIKLESKCFPCDDGDDNGDNDDEYDHKPKVHHKLFKHSTNT